MIELVDITAANWIECIKLSVLPEQKSFVAPNVYSLAESKYHPDMIPLGISCDGKLAGFAMIGYEPEKSKSWIIRFMIDAKLQKKGYGSEALAGLIKLLSEKYPHCDIRLSVEPENAAAIKLYEKFGFRATGEIDDGEHVYDRSKSLPPDYRGG